MASEPVGAETGGPHRIRPADAGDVRDVAALEAVCFAPPWPEESVRETLARDDVLGFVAVEADGSEAQGPTIVGYAVFVRLLDESELLRVGVTPGRRGRGLGRRLILAGLARCPGPCHLEVRAGSRTARDLYRRLGFSEVGRRRAYYGDEDAILYTRPGDPRPPPGS